MKQAGRKEAARPCAARRDIFNKKHSLDLDLLKIIGDTEGYNFLTTPVTQYMHIYLIEYLISFAKKWLITDKLKILDWGCGKGQVSYLCQKRGIEIVSCDVKGGGGDSAFKQKTPIIDHSKINVVPLEHPYKLPFADISFDVVLSFGVLEHVPNDLESLKEIQRVLRPNGLFFCFFLPYKYSWRSKIIYMKGNRYHDHFYDYHVIKKLTKEANLRVLDFWYRDVLPLKKYTPFFRFVERMDYLICKYTFIKYFASNIEFVACKN